MQDTPSSDTAQQIVVGQYIYQTGQPQGGLVQPATAVPPAAVPQPLPTPVTIRPRPFRQLLGRETEIAWVTELLQQQISAEFYSEPGMGKTALLRHLAYHPVTGQFPDGIVYLVASQEPAEDVLYALYTAFYQSALPHKPTESSLRRSLQNRKALILLDDFDLGQEELARLLNAAPACTFLIASPSRALQGDGEARALFGLSTEHALTLVTKVWGRPLDKNEQADALAICGALKGHPLRIQQTIMAAREQHLSLHDVRQQLPDEPILNLISRPQLRQQLVAAFDEGELQVLCFDLGVDYESLPAQGKGNKARELIELLVRHGRLPDLIVHLSRTRPNLNWDEPTQTVVDSTVKALPLAERDILSVLAAFGARPLSAELIGQLVGQPDVSSLLEELMQRGLVQNTAYHLAGSLPHRFHSDLEPMLLYLVEWAPEQEVAVLRREAKTLAFLQQWAATNGRPAEALQVGQLLDGILALDGRWGLWQQVLLTAQQAAQAIGDKAAEAWSLNQLGCRALCLGDKGVARIQLERAKALNEAVGNEAGTAVNEHNLGILHGILVTRSGWRRLTPFMIGAVVLLALLGWWLSRTAAAPPIAPTATTANLVLATEPPPVATDTAVPAETAVPLPGSASEPTLTMTAIATRVPATTTPATGTASATPTLSATVTMTPTTMLTPTATPTPTRTPTLTLTPSPTNTRWPTPLPTFTLAPAIRPDLIAPEQGSTHRTSVTFQWRGILQASEHYRLQLRHTDSGFTLESPLLTEPVWTTILPAQQFGEWHWQVAVISNEVTRTTSANWHFYLDPFPHSNNPPRRSPTPTVVPTAVPSPAPLPINTSVPPPQPTSPIILVTLSVPG